MADADDEVRRLRLCPRCHRLRTLVDVTVPPALSDLGTAIAKRRRGNHR
jgi:hypothetical protein